MTQNLTGKLGFSTYALVVCGWKRVTESLRSFASLVDSKLSTGNLMRRDVCAPATGVITQVYVHDGQEIKQPGEHLFDIRLPDGTLMSVVSIDRGFITHLDQTGLLGQSLLFSMGDGSELDVHVEAGTPIFGMLPNRAGASRETNSALKPCASWKMFQRRMGLLDPAVG